MVCTVWTGSLTTSDNFYNHALKGKCLDMQKRKCCSPPLNATMSLYIRTSLQWTGWSSSCFSQCWIRRRCRILVVNNEWHITNVPLFKTKYLPNCGLIFKRNVNSRIRRRFYYHEYFMKESETKFEARNVFRAFIYRRSFQTWQQHPSLPCSLWQ